MLKSDLCINTSIFTSSACKWDKEEMYICTNKSDIMRCSSENAEAVPLTVLH